MKKFIGIAFDITWAGRNQSNQEQNDPSQRKQRGESTREKTQNPVERLQELTPDLIAWGTDEVIASWISFRKAGLNPNKENPKEILLAFDDFLRAIRKDLGHSDEHLKKGDLLRIFIKDIDSLR